jgi:hypothetical protein
VALPHQQLALVRKGRRSLGGPMVSRDKVKIK